MNDEIRVVKRCPHCGTRLFDKISLTTGFVEIKCPHCKHVVCINLALRRSRPGHDRWPYWDSCSGF